MTRTYDMYSRNQTTIGNSYKYTTQQLQFLESWSTPYTDKS